MEVKRAVLYARVSHDDREREGRNLKSQLDMCRAYTLARGWDIIAELAEDDRGASGARLDLPQLNQMLDWAKQHRFDVLVVRELDRLARSLPKQLLIESILTKAGIQIEYVLGEYPNTAEGTFLKNVRAAIAELERLKIAERTTRGKIQAVKAGNIMVGSLPPYGYEKYRINGKTQLRIREDEAQIVRLIYEWYGNGDEEGIKRSVREIAQRLTAMRVPTYSDTRPHLVNRQYLRHGYWSPSTVQGLLRKTEYMGQWYYLKRQAIGERKVLRPVEEQIAVEIPAIVDAATWLAVQVRREMPRRKANPLRASKFLLTGYISCDVCNARMFGVVSMSGKTRSIKHSYYSCGDRRYSRDRMRDCIAPYFHAEPLETAVWQWVESLLADRALLDREVQALQESWVERTADLRAELEQVQARKALYERRQQALLDRYLDAKLSRTTWREQNTALKITLHQLTQAQATLTAKLESGNITERQKIHLHEFAGRLLARLQSASDLHEARRHLLAVLKLQVVVGIDVDGRRNAQVTCEVGPTNAPRPPVVLSQKLWLPAAPTNR